jgi:hypothetical protein
MTSTGLGSLISAPRRKKSVCDTVEHISTPWVCASTYSSTVTRQVLHEVNSFGESRRVF